MQMRKYCLCHDRNINTLIAQCSLKLCTKVCCIYISMNERRITVVYFVDQD